MRWINLPRNGDVLERKKISLKYNKKFETILERYFPMKRNISEKFKQFKNI